GTNSSRGGWLVSRHGEAGKNRTYIDSGVVDLEQFCDFPFPPTGRLGVLEELALQKLDFILGQPWLWFILLGGWHVSVVVHHGPLFHLCHHVQLFVGIRVRVPLMGGVVLVWLHVVVTGWLATVAKVCHVVHRLAGGGAGLLHGGEGSRRRIPKTRLSSNA